MPHKIGATCQTCGTDNWVQRGRKPKVRIECAVCRPSYRTDANAWPRVVMVVQTYVKRTNGKERKKVGDLYRATICDKALKDCAVLVAHKQGRRYYLEAIRKDELSGKTAQEKKAAAQIMVHGMKNKVPERWVGNA